MSKAKAMTKSQLAAVLSEKTKLTKSQILDVFASLIDVTRSELKAKRPMSIPNLVKITLKQKDATPARAGINPFTKEKITIKAKPARKVVKVKPTKELKEMA